MGVFCALESVIAANDSSSCTSQRSVIYVTNPLFCSPKCSFFVEILIPFAV